MRWLRGTAPRNPLGAARNGSRSIKFAPIGIRVLDLMNATDPIPGPVQRSGSPGRNQSGSGDRRGRQALHRSAHDRKRPPLERGVCARPRPFGRRRSCTAEALQDTRPSHLRVQLAIVARDECSGCITQLECDESEVSMIGKQLTAIGRHSENRGPVADRRALRPISSPTEYVTATSSPSTYGASKAVRNATDRPRPSCRARHVQKSSTSSASA